MKLHHIKKCWRQNNNKNTPKPFWEYNSPRFLCTYYWSCRVYPEPRYYINLRQVFRFYTVNMGIMIFMFSYVNKLNQAVLILSLWNKVNEWIQLLWLTFGKSLLLSGPCWTVKITSADLSSSDMLCTIKTRGSFKMWHPREPSYPLTGRWLQQRMEGEKKNSHPFYFYQLLIHTVDE